MRKTQPIMIGDLLSDFFTSDSRIANKLAQARAIDCWGEVAGKFVAGATLRINISGKKMFVYIGSSTIRHEVFMRRSELIREINSVVGQEVVTAIIVR